MSVDERTSETVRSTLSRFRFRGVFPHRAWHHGWPLLLGLLASVSCPPAARADVITISATPSYVADTLSIHVRNDGDEPAVNVQVSIDLQGIVRQSPMVEALHPGEAYRFPFAIDEREGVGTYAVAMLIEYSDANLHPFSSPLVYLLRIGPARRSEVFGSIDPTSISDEAALSLHLHNQGETAREVAVRFHGPRELPALEKEQVVVLDPLGEEDITFHLRNFAATPRSRYTIFAILTYEADGLLFASFARGEVEVVLPSRFLSPRLWTGLGLLLVIVATITVWRRTRRSSAQELDAHR